MSQTAAHRVDHVIPRVPVRQWVLSLPRPLRPLQAAAITYCIAFGARGGQRRPAALRSRRAGVPREAGGVGGVLRGRWPAVISASRTDVIGDEGAQ